MSDVPQCVDCAHLNIETYGGRCWTCDRAAEYARGVADERARVVAWLRAKGWQVGKQQRVVMFTVADRIEGSKHEEKP